jgi:hypothetical protein
MAKIILSIEPSEDDFKDIKNETMLMLCFDSFPTNSVTVNRGSPNPETIICTIRVLNGYKSLPFNVNVWCQNIQNETVPDMDRVELKMMNRVVWQIGKHLRDSNWNTVKTLLKFSSPYQFRFFQNLDKHVNAEQIPEDYDNVPLETDKMYIFLCERHVYTCRRYPEESAWISSDRKEESESFYNLWNELQRQLMDDSTTKTNIKFEGATTVGELIHPKVSVKHVWSLSRTGS